MAFNNFNAGYSMYPQQPQVPIQSSNSFNWVQGEAGAKSYPVAPGNRVALFDAESPVVYIKEVDMYGKPMEIETYDLVRRTQTPIKEPEAPRIDLSNYITREEMIDAITAAVSQEVERAISEISLKPTSTKKKKEVTE